MVTIGLAERSDDGCGSLSQRAERSDALKAAGKDKRQYAEVACRLWLDVRAFGQVFAFKSGKDKEAGVSVGVRWPVNLPPAISCDAVDIESLQITKSVNSESGEKKSSDTMGSKHRVSFGLYSFCGSINCQLAERTGFTDEDALKILEALKTLFDNNSSSARPEGSM